MDAGAGKKQRITITIGDDELTLAKASGEPVSSYIQRLIREDSDKPNPGIAPTRNNPFGM